MIGAMKSNPTRKLLSMQKSATEISISLNIVFKELKPGYLIAWKIHYASKMF